MIMHAFDSFIPTQKYVTGHPNPAGRPPTCPNDGECPFRANYKCPLLGFLVCVKFVPDMLDSFGEVLEYQKTAGPPAQRVGLGFL